MISKIFAIVNKNPALIITGGINAVFFPGNAVNYLGKTVNRLNNQANHLNNPIN